MSMYAAPNLEAYSSGKRQVVERPPVTGRPLHCKAVSAKKERGKAIEWMVYITVTKRTRRLHKLNL